MWRLFYPEQSWRAEGQAAAVAVRNQQTGLNQTQAVQMGRSGCLAPPTRGADWRQVTGGSSSRVCVRNENFYWLINCLVPGGGSTAEIIEVMSSFCRVT